jgi:hypothetical protein
MEFYSNINNTNTNGENIGIQYIKKTKKEDLEEEEKLCQIYLDIYQKNISNILTLLQLKYLQHFYLH